MCYDDGDLMTYLDGELTPDEAAVLEEHLCVCPACRERLKELRVIDTLLRQYFRERMAEADRYFDVEAAWERLQRRLQERQRKAWYRRFTWAGVLGVAAALLLVIGVVGGGRFWHEQTMPTPRQQVAQQPAATGPAAAPAQHDPKADSGVEDHGAGQKVPVGAAGTGAGASAPPVPIESPKLVRSAAHPGKEAAGPANHRGGNGGRKYAFSPLDERDVEGIALHRAQHDPVAIEDAATVHRVVYLLNACIGAAGRAQMAMAAEEPEPAVALEIRLKTGEKIRVTPVEGDAVRIILPDAEAVVASVPEFSALLKEVASRSEAP